MNDFLELKTRINGLIDELVARSDGGPGSQPSGDWVPKVDMYDLPDRIVLRADLPGVLADDLDVRLEGHQLVIRGVRRQPQDLDAESLCRLERPFGAFARRYALPESLDAEQVRAACRNGELEVVVRKREPSQTRRISVESP